jgi:hypothetical protein
MAWIESHQAIGQHPKTIALAHQLGVSLPTAVGHLHYLWWWALDYAPDGELKRHSPSIIAHACQWRGKPERLLQALVEVGFLEGDESGARIHDWEEYAGKLIDRRATNRERMRSARAAHGANGVQPTSGETVHARVGLPGSDARVGLPDRTIPDLPDHTGPETSLSRPEKLNPAGPARPGPAPGGRARENGPDPKLLAEHLARIERERASRARPGQPDLRNSFKTDEDDGAVG